MMRHTPRLLTCTLVACAVLIAAAPVHAGQLASDIANSYNTSWAGTSPFSSGTLNGYVDWAVYGPGNTPAGMAGYTVTAGELMYAYQIFVDLPASNAPVSGLSVNVQNPANNIGTFTASLISGDAPDFFEFATGEAKWYFFSGIQPGDNSLGLAFSSPNVPMWDTATVLDGGQSDQIAVPSTSPLNIPEPSTFILVLCGAAVFACQWLRRAGRRSR